MPTKLSVHGGVVGQCKRALLATHIHEQKHNELSNQLSPL